MEIEDDRNNNIHCSCATFVFNCLCCSITFGCWRLRSHLLDCTVAISVFSAFSVSRTSFLIFLDYVMINDYSLNCHIPIALPSIPVSSVFLVLHVPCLYLPLPASCVFRLVITVLLQIRTKKIRTPWWYKHVNTLGFIVQSFTVSRFSKSSMSRISKDFSAW